MSEKIYKIHYMHPQTGEVIITRKGTAADLARDYCLINGIKLFTALYEDGHIWLMTDFREIEPDTFSRIAQFKDSEVCDFETGYKLLFESFLLPESGKSSQGQLWSITEAAE